MRWQTYVWQLGKITDVVTSATPQFFKKFNYRMIWSDGPRRKGPAQLTVENYGYGAHARYDSWVILKADKRA